MEKIEPHLQTVLNHVLPAAWNRFYLNPYLLITTGFVPSNAEFEGFVRAFEDGAKEFAVQDARFIQTTVGLGFQKWVGEGVRLVEIGVTFRGHRTVLVVFYQNEVEDLVVQTLGKVRTKLFQREFKPA
mmetsp:Transcript_19172/g.35011  ORF Transcript_19172/g.35011 Transcript_19172/m.35011 type:complete len:128 (-) Transcript_19172:723-1106(-)